MHKAINETNNLQTMIIEFTLQIRKFHRIRKAMQ